MTELHSHDADYTHLTSGLSRSLKNLVDDLFQPNRVEYLSTGLNLLVIPKSSIRTRINRMLHMHVLMVSQFGCSRIYTFRFNVKV